MTYLEANQAANLNNEKIVWVQSLHFNGPDLANKFLMICLKENLKVEQKPNLEQTHMYM